MHFKATVRNFPVLLDMKPQFVDTQVLPIKVPGLVRWFNSLNVKVS